MRTGLNHLQTVIIVILFLSLIDARVSLSQELVRVNAEGRAEAVGAGNGHDHIRDRAIAFAEQNALVKGLAAEITPEALLVNFRLSGSMLNAIPYGKVVRKKVLEEGWINFSHDNSLSKKFYRVQIDADVTNESVEQSPTFYLNADLNQSRFQDGDELTIRIRSTKACCFAILNILEGNKITPLLPNANYKKNSLEANEVFTFPSEQDQRQGFKIRVHLPENTSKTTESIYIVALLHPFFLTTTDPQKLLKELIRNVIVVPPHARADKLLQYQIHASK